MSNPLSIPPELQHLIEKRELEDRRSAKRRSGADRRQLDSGPLSAASSLEALEALTNSEAEKPEDLAASTSELEKLVVEDRRSGKDQRKRSERREKTRREKDRERSSGS